MRCAIACLLGLFAAAAPFGTDAATYDDTDTAVLIHINKNGELNVTDVKGQALEACTVGPDKSGARCRGFGPDSEILQLQSTGVFRTRGSSCIVVIDYVTGGGKQVCW